MFFWVCSHIFTYEHLGGWRKDFETILNIDKQRKLDVPWKRSENIFARFVIKPSTFDTEIQNDTEYTMEPVERQQVHLLWIFGIIFKTQFSKNP